MYENRTRNYSEIHEEQLIYDTSIILSHHLQPCADYTSIAINTTEMQQFSAVTVSQKFGLKILFLKKSKMWNVWGFKCFFVKKNFKTQVLKSISTAPKVQIQDGGPSQCLTSPFRFQIFSSVSKPQRLNDEQSLYGLKLRQSYAHYMTLPHKNEEERLASQSK